MPLTHTVYESVDQVPGDEWNKLTSHDIDITWDRRLIGAFEQKMVGQCECFTVVVRNENGAPVGLGCMCLFRVDMGNFPWVQKLVKAARKVWANAFTIGVLFCGLPLPSGQNHLIVLDELQRESILTEIDRAMRIIAKKHRAMMAVILAFDEKQCEQLKTLDSLGYLRGEIPPRHCLHGKFADFADYLDRLKARYRSQVNRSFKKFESGGFRVEQVTGPTKLAEVYTDDVHKLYEAVFNRSQYKLEHYPAEFIRELGRRFGEDATLTCIYLGDRIAGFTLGVRRGNIYHNLYSGFDYKLKNEGDLYFNLFYRDSDFAWKRGATEIHLGQTSDDFKSRLGSKIDPLFLFIRPRNALIRWGMKKFKKLALPAVAKVEAHDVFKSEEQKTKPPRRQDAKKNAENSI